MHTVSSREMVNNVRVERMNVLLRLKDGTGGLLCKIYGCVGVGGTQQVVGVSGLQSQSNDRKRLVGRRLRVVLRGNQFLAYL